MCDRLEAWAGTLHGRKPGVARSAAGIRHSASGKPLGNLTTFPYAHRRAGTAHKAADHASADLCVLRRHRSIHLLRAQLCADSGLGLLVLKTAGRLHCLHILIGLVTEHASRLPLRGQHLLALECGSTAGRRLILLSSRARHLTSLLCGGHAPRTGDGTSGVVDVVLCGLSELG